MPNTYLNFDLLIEERTDHYSALVHDSPGGQVRQSSTCRYPSLTWRTCSSACSVHYPEKREASTRPKWPMPGPSDSSCLTLCSARRS